MTKQARKIEQKRRYNLAFGMPDGSMVPHSMRRIRQRMAVMSPAEVRALGKSAMFGMLYGITGRIIADDAPTSYGEFADKIANVPAIEHYAVAGQTFTVPINVGAVEDNNETLARMKRSEAARKAAATRKRNREGQQ